MSAAGKNDNQIEQLHLEGTHLLRRLSDLLAEMRRLGPHSATGIEKFANLQQRVSILAQTHQPFVDAMRVPPSNMTRS